MSPKDYVETYFFVFPLYGIVHYSKVYLFEWQNPFTFSDLWNNGHFESSFRYQQFIDQFPSTPSSRSLLLVFSQFYKRKSMWLNKRNAFWFRNSSEFYDTYFPMSSSTFSWPKIFKVSSSALICPEYLSKNAFALKTGFWG